MGLVFLGDSLGGSPSEDDPQLDNSVFISSLDYFNEGQGGEVITPAV